MKNVIVLLFVLCVLDIIDFRVPVVSSFGNLTLARSRRSDQDNKISCILPPQPKNGRWILINGVGREGDTVTQNTLLRFYCKKGYTWSSRSPYRVCDKNWSTKKFPECWKLCPPMYSTPTINVTCVDKRGRTINCYEATEGSYLTYTCAAFYEVPFGYKTSAVCSDGDWSSPNPICQPICGKKVDDDTTPLLYGGKVEEVIGYPWIVTLYKKVKGEYLNVCGGSLVSQNIILTAAHCVTNNYGDVLPTEYYLVGAGKLHNKYNDSRDSQAQYLNILHIVVHPTYKGDSRRFLADVAIIITKEAFVLNKFVQPVCFSDVKNVNLQVGAVGVVAGFGVKEDGEPSDELRTLEIPYKSEATCAKELPGDWGDRYNVIDKLCAGHYNKNMSICKGDSGNGLVFKNSDNNRYYIHGVVSLGHSQKGECNVQQNSLYTKVAFHYDFIDREIAKYYIRDCSLPPYPDNGKWVIENEDKKPGDNVPSHTLLKISCNDGYKMSSDNAHIKCESSFVMPMCRRLCPEIRLSSVTNYNCTSKEGELINCNEATDYTTLTFSCPTDYVILDDLKNTRQCLNGAWELPTPACQPIETSTEDPEEFFTKVICVYDSKQFDNGVKPEDLNASLCSHIIYDSVGLWQDGNLRVNRTVRDTENDSYRSVANMKKQNAKLKLMLSVYGSGSKESYEYHTVASDPVKRATFIDSATNFLETYGYDGINIHWDPVLAKEQDYYIYLMKELKEAFRKRKWLVSTTVYYAPTWLGYNPQELYDHVDWINIANYDFYAEWSKYTGQNSPLYSSSVENDYESTNYNLRNSANMWRAMGIRENKISPSIAFYGRYFTLKDPRRHGLHAPITGITDTNNTGRINYSEICEKYGNWTRIWDDEQKNPYTYNKNKWIGYDDKKSVQLKAEFVQKQGYFGVTVYPVDGDDVFGKCGPKQILLKYVHVGLHDDVVDLGNVQQVLPKCEVTVE